MMETQYIKGLKSMLLVRNMRNSVILKDLKTCIALAWGLDNVVVLY